MNEHIKLTTDPVNGSVSVAVPHYFFSIEWLFCTAPKDTLISSRAFHGAAVRECHIHRTSHEGIARSWMALLEVAVPIKIDRLASVQKFIVDWTMRSEEIRLRCDWDSIVLLALAVGTSPNDADFNSAAQGQKGIFSLRPKENTIEVTVQSGLTLVTLYSESAGVLMLSWRAAYAWTLTMIRAKKDGCLDLMPLINNPVRVKKSDNPRLARSWIPSAGQMELECSPNLWADALTWTLYTEEVFNEPTLKQEPELLPVPQFLLKLREDAVVDLQTSGGALDKQMARIFSGIDGASDLKEEIMRGLREIWRTSEVMGKLKITCVESQFNYKDHKKVWTKLQRIPLFGTLLEKYGPWSRSQEPPEVLEKSTLMGVLARIVIVISVIRRWPRDPWSEGRIRSDGDDDGKPEWKVPPNPVKGLLWPPNGSHPVNIYLN